MYCTVELFIMSESEINCFLVHLTPVLVTPVCEQNSV